MPGATMPRKPGTPKTGGRAAGTPNKRNAALAERLAKVMGETWCPVVAMAQIANDKGTDLPTRVRCLSEVAPYLYPRKKATEIGLGDGLGLEQLIAASDARFRTAEATPAPTRPAVAEPTPDTPNRLASRTRARDPEPEPVATPDPPPPAPAAPSPAPFRMPMATEPDSYADTTAPYNPEVH